jgi:hypothetical protein
LNILRTFRLAISLRVLVFGAAGVLLTLTGWQLIGGVFSGDKQVAAWSKAAVGNCPWTRVAACVPSEPKLPSFRLYDLGEQLAVSPVPESWNWLSEPIRQIFASPRSSPAALAYLVLSGLWGIAVWAFFGGAISRVAAVQLACEERVGWGAALRFALSKWPSYFAAPLFPLLGVVLAAVPLCILGLILRANAGIFLVGLIWPLLLLAGLIMALLLLGLVFGWPLMWATISTEGTDAFDALSRSYAYVFQRPLRYLFYVVMATVLGWLGWLLVENFAAAVIWLAYWAAGWGSGGAQIEAIRDGSLTGIGYAGSALIRFWGECVKFLAVGYFYGFFWTAASAIYLLLRRDVDATEMDEVFLDADRSERAEGLPTTSEDNGDSPPSDSTPKIAPDAAGGAEKPPA